MAVPVWTTPKINWTNNDRAIETDFNRIEGNTQSIATVLVATGTATAILLTLGTLFNNYSTVFIAANTNNNAATTINGLPFYKPNSTTPPNIVKGQAYTIWFSSSDNCIYYVM
jgi:hypothetical protein